MGIKFKCPNCSGEDRLECCEDGVYHSEIIKLDEEGDFEYGAIDAYGDVVRFQCLKCGYILKDEDGENIIHNEDVVEWCKKHCNQEERQL